MPHISSRVIALCIIIILTFGQRPSAQVPGTPIPDPYFIDFVASALRFVADPPDSPIATFQYQKFTKSSPRLSQLGDGVTIAALKILGGETLLLPKQTNAYLVLVRDAFSDQARVLQKSNTDPSVTLFVLEYLKAKKADDAETLKRISYLQGCVTDFSCSAYGEHLFLTRQPLPRPKPPSN